MKFLWLENVFQSIFLGICTPVIKRSNGKSSFSIGIRNTSSKGLFSIAMLVYQRVPSKITWMFQPAMLADPAAGCGKLRLPIRFTGQVQVVIKWVLKR